MKSKTSYVFIAIRILLGIPLLIAGLSKITDPQSFADTINNFNLIPYQLTNLLAILIPWLEITVAISLITGLLVKGGVFLGLILFNTFTFAISWAYTLGINTECGCFGNLVNQRVDLVRLLESVGYLTAAILVFAFYWRKNHE